MAGSAESGWMPSGEVPELIRVAITQFSDVARNDPGLQRPLSGIGRQPRRARRCDVREALDLVWLVDAPNSWSSGLERIEEFAGTERATAIAGTFVDLDLDHRLVAAGVLADFVAQHGRAACGTVDYPDRLERTVRNKIIKIDSHRSHGQDP